MRFTLRKLCSSIEEYKANADSIIDPDSIETNLSQCPEIEVVHSGLFLIILFENMGVVFKIFPSRRALVQANLREDAERACLILAEAVNNNGIQ